MYRQSSQSSDSQPVLEKSNQLANSRKECICSLQVRDRQEKNISMINAVQTQFLPSNKTYLPPIHRKSCSDKHFKSGNFHCTLQRCSKEESVRKNIENFKEYCKIKEQTVQAKPYQSQIEVEEKIWNETNLTRDNKKYKKIRIHLLGDDSENSPKEEYHERNIKRVCKKQLSNSTSHRTSTFYNDKDISNDSLMKITGTDKINENTIHVQEVNERSDSENNCMSEREYPGLFEEENRLSSTVEIKTQGMFKSTKEGSYSFGIPVNLDKTFTDKEDLMRSTDPAKLIEQKQERRKSILKNCKSFTSIMYQIIPEAEQDIAVYSANEIIEMEEKKIPSFQIFAENITNKVNHTKNTFQSHSKEKEGFDLDDPLPPVPPRSHFNTDKAESVKINQEQRLTQLQLLENDRNERRSIKNQVPCQTQHTTNLRKINTNYPKYENIRKFKNSNKNEARYKGDGTMLYDASVQTSVVNLANKHDKIVQTENKSLMMNKQSQTRRPKKSKCLKTNVFVFSNIREGKGQRILLHKGNMYFNKCHLLVLRSRSKGRLSDQIEELLNSPCKETYSFNKPQTLSQNKEYKKEKQKEPETKGKLKSAINNKQPATNQELKKPSFSDSMQLPYTSKPVQAMISDCKEENVKINSTLEFSQKSKLLKRQWRSKTPIPSQAVNNNHYSIRDHISMANQERDFDGIKCKNETRYAGLGEIIDKAFSDSEEHFSISESSTALSPPLAKKRKKSSDAITLCHSHPSSKSKSHVTTETSTINIAKNRTAGTGKTTLSTVSGKSPNSYKQGTNRKSSPDNAPSSTREDSLNSVYHKSLNACKQSTIRQNLLVNAPSLTSETSLNSLYPKSLNSYKKGTNRQNLLVNTTSSTSEASLNSVYHKSLSLSSYRQGTKRQNLLVDAPTSTSQMSKKYVYHKRPNSYKQGTNRQNLLDNAPSSTSETSLNSVYHKSPNSYKKRTIRKNLLVNAPSSTRKTSRNSVYHKSPNLYRKGTNRPNLLVNARSSTSETSLNSVDHKSPNSYKQGNNRQNLLVNARSSTSETSLNSVDHKSPNSYKQDTNRSLPSTKSWVNQTETTLNVCSSPQFVSTKFLSAAEDVLSGNESESTIKTSFTLIQPVIKKRKMSDDSRDNDSGTYPNSFPNSKIKETSTTGPTHKSEKYDILPFSDCESENISSLNDKPQHMSSFEEMRNNQASKLRKIKQLKIPVKTQELDDAEVIIYYTKKHEICDSTLENKEVKLSKIVTSFRYLLKFIFRSVFEPNTQINHTPTTTNVNDPINCKPKSDLLNVFVFTASSHANNNC